MEDGRAVETLERLRSQKADRPGPLLTGRNGQLWFLGETVRGLIPEIDFVIAPITIAFRPHPAWKTIAAISGWRRSAKAWWNGCPIPSWQRWFPEDFGKETPVQVVRDPKGSNSSPLRKVSSTRIATPIAGSHLAKQPNRYYALLPLANGEFLASIANFGLARISAKGEVLEHVQISCPNG